MAKQSLHRITGPLTRRSLLTLAAGMTVALSATVAGCSGGVGSDASDTVAQAEATMKALKSAHFTMTSKNVPKGGTRLIAAEGDVARPDGFSGDLTMQFDEPLATVSVVSLGGTVYIKDPFSSTFAETNPADFGLSDPGLLVHPERGIVRILSELQDPISAGKKRYGADVVEVVTGTVDGQIIADLLTSAKPEVPVQVELSIATETGELRKASLTGPFYEGADNVEFTLVFVNYDKPVSIAVPELG